MSDFPDDIDPSDVIFQFDVSLERQNKYKHEDIAQKYIVVKEDGAWSGIIVYARYGESRWVVNPTNTRHLIEHLLCMSNDHTQVWLLFEHLLNRLDNPRPLIEYLLIRLGSL